MKRTRNKSNNIYSLEYVRDWASRRIVEINGDRPARPYTARDGEVAVLSHFLTLSSRECLREKDVVDIWRSLEMGLEKFEGDGRMVAEALCMHYTEYRETELFNGAMAPHVPAWGSFDFLESGFRSTLALMCYDHVPLDLSPIVYGKLAEKVVATEKNHGAYRNAWGKTVHQVSRMLKKITCSEGNSTKGLVYVLIEGWYKLMISTYNEGQVAIPYIEDEEGKLSQSMGNAVKSLEQASLDTSESGGIDIRNSTEKRLLEIFDEMIDTDNPKFSREVTMLPDGSKSTLIKLDDPDEGDMNTLYSLLARISEEMPVYMGGDDIPEELPPGTIRIDENGNEEFFEDDEGEEISINEMRREVQSRIDDIVSSCSWPYDEYTQGYLRFLTEMRTMLSRLDRPFMIHDTIEKLCGVLAWISMNAINLCGKCEACKRYIISTFINEVRKYDPNDEHHLLSTESGFFDQDICSLSQLLDASGISIMDGKLGSSSPERISGWLAAVNDMEDLTDSLEWEGTPNVFSAEADDGKNWNRLFMENTKPNPS